MGKKANIDKEDIGRRRGHARCPPAPGGRGGGGPPGGYWDIKSYIISL
jgi:hypothetical protein